MSYIYRKIKRLPTYLYSYFLQKNKIYKYKNNRYESSFICADSKNEKKLGSTKKIESVLFCFWTGDNELSKNRINSLESIKSNSGVEVKLININNLNDFIKVDAPLHPAYEYLSLVHRSDYLRCYFMHHHGGGYVDIKEIDNLWIYAFNKLNDTDLFAIGYQEIGEYGVPNIEGNIGKDIKLYYRYLLGNCGYIFRPNTPFTKEWYKELHFRLDELLDELKINPGNCRGSNSGYPVKWSYLLAEIFHPLCLKYHNRISFDAALKPKFVNYQ